MEPCSTVNDAPKPSDSRDEGEALPLREFVPACDEPVAPQVPRVGDWRLLCGLSRRVCRSQVKRVAALLSTIPAVASSSAPSSSQPSSSTSAHGHPERSTLLSALARVDLTHLQRRRERPPAEPERAVRMSADELMSMHIELEM